MRDIIIKISNDSGTTWTDMQTPSSYKLSLEDLDKDSYRSVVNGDLIRTRLKPRWIKLQLSFKYMTDNQLDTIARQVNTNPSFKVKCICPAFGTSDWVEFEAYTSKYNAEMIDKQLGWKVDFNIIQCTGGSFQ